MNLFEKIRSYFSKRKPERPPLRSVESYPEYLDSGPEEEEGYEEELVNYGQAAGNAQWRPGPRRDATPSMN